MVSRRILRLAFLTILAPGGWATAVLGSDREPTKRTDAQIRERQEQIAVALTKSPELALASTKLVELFRINSRFSKRLGEYRFRGDVNGDGALTPVDLCHLRLGDSFFAFCAAWDSFRGKLHRSPAAPSKDLIVADGSTLFISFEEIASVIARAERRRSDLSRRDTKVSKERLQRISALTRPVISNQLSRDLLPLWEDLVRDVRDLRSRLFARHGEIPMIEKFPLLSTEGLEEEPLVPLMRLDDFCLGLDPREEDSWWAEYRAYVPESSRIDSPGLEKRFSRYRDDSRALGDLWKERVKSNGMWLEQVEEGGLIHNGMEDPVDRAEILGAVRWVEWSIVPRQLVLNPFEVDLSKGEKQLTSSLGASYNRLQLLPQEGIFIPKQASGALGAQVYPVFLLAMKHLRGMLGEASAFVEDDFLLWFDHHRDFLWNQNLRDQVGRKNRTDYLVASLSEGQPGPSFLPGIVKDNEEKSEASKEAFLPSADVTRVESVLAFLNDFHHIVQLDCYRDGEVNAQDKRVYWEMARLVVPVVESIDENRKE